MMMESGIQLCKIEIVDAGGIQKSSGNSKKEKEICGKLDLLKE